MLPDYCQTKESNSNSLTSFGLKGHINFYKNKVNVECWTENILKTKFIKNEKPKIYTLLANELNPKERKLL
jgi:hypothetical protein